MALTKKDLKNLPKSNGDPRREQGRLYTELVFTGLSRRKAFEEVFPEKVKALKVKYPESAYAREVARMVHRIERGSFVQECFTIANKDWWTKFITKKQDIYEKLYDTAMDKNEKTVDRLNASKIFLTNVPDAPKEDIKLKVEVKVGSDEFKKMLDQKKRELHGAANGDIIEAEVEGEVVADE